MKKITTQIVMFLIGAMTFQGANATAAGLEIDFKGLSPAAQRAIENMSQAREEAREILKVSLSRLHAMKETYVNACAHKSSPIDTGCQALFGEIIDANREIIKFSADFLGNYRYQLKIVVGELEPQIKAAAYNYKPSDIMFDLVNKWGEKWPKDQVCGDISYAFGLGYDSTPFEIVSNGYLQFYRDLERYQMIISLLHAEILIAKKRRKPDMIFNPQYFHEIETLRTLIFEKRKIYRSCCTVRTTVLR